MFNSLHTFRKYFVIYRAECLDDSECRGHQVCSNSKCVDPCAGTCGANANCEARNHLPVCSCPAGYTGDPFSQCRRFNPGKNCPNVSDFKYYG